MDYEKRVAAMENWLLRLAERHEAHKQYGWCMVTVHFQFNVTENVDFWMWEAPMVATDLVDVGVDPLDIVWHQNDYSMWDSIHGGMSG